MHMLAVAFSCGTDTATKDFPKHHQDAKIGLIFIPNQCLGNRTASKQKSNKQLRVQISFFHRRVFGYSSRARFAQKPRFGRQLFWASFAWGVSQTNLIKVQGFSPLRILLALWGISLRCTVTWLHSHSGGGKTCPLLPVQCITRSDAEETVFNVRWSISKPLCTWIQTSRVSWDPSQ